MKQISNARKAREIANDCCTHICLADCSAESYFGSENDCYKAAMEAMSWKDKERKELWRITRNHYQEWAEEQIAKEKQKLIEKACEFIETNGCLYIDYDEKGADINTTKMICDIKQLLKGE